MSLVAEDGRLAEELRARLPAVHLLLLPFSGGRRTRMSAMARQSGGVCPPLKDVDMSNFDPSGPGTKIASGYSSTEFDSLKLGTKLGEGRGVV